MQGELQPKIQTTTPTSRQTPQPNTSIFFCPNHKQSQFKLTKPTGKTTLTCKSCGFKVAGSTGYLSCSQCKPATVLCSSCKICKNNHFLSKVFSVRTFEANPLYLRNKFSCVGCKVVKDVGNEGVYHCGTCDFTVCMECVKNQDRMWV